MNNKFNFVSSLLLDTNLCPLLMHPGVLIQHHVLPYCTYTQVTTTIYWFRRVARGVSWLPRNPPNAGIVGGAYYAYALRYASTMLYYGYRWQLA